MPIQDSDLFLIEDTSGVSKKIAASKLKENLAANTYNNYKLLVNKPDYSSRFVYAQNMQQSVAPTDYMMVERSGVSYKITGQQIIDYFPSMPAGGSDMIVNVEKKFYPAGRVDTGQFPLPEPSKASYDLPYTYRVYYCAAEGNGVIVAAGYRYTSSGDVISYSTDGGVSWNAATVPSGSQIYPGSIAYGDGKFVIIGSGEARSHYYSTDGINWTRNEGILDTFRCYGLTYGNGKFIAVGWNSTVTTRIWYSSDGLSWTAASWTNTPSDDWYDVAYGDGKYVAVGYGVSATSADGITWTYGTKEASPNYWTSIAYGKNLFVVKRNSQTFVYSSDGINWLETNGTGSGLVNVSFGNEVFFAPGSTGGSSPYWQALLWSYDGINWISETVLGFTGDDRGVATQFGTFLGDRFMWFPAQQQYTTRYPITYARYSFTGSDTDYNESILTLASDTNLDLFTPGDAINMVDSNGDVASYTPVTSTIANVDTTPIVDGEESVLTFTSPNPDLKFFNPGDGVQDDPYWDQSKEWSSRMSGGSSTRPQIITPQALFDGSTDTYASVDGGQNYVNEIIIDFEGGFEINYSLLELFCYSATPTLVTRVYLNGSSSGMLLPYNGEAWYTIGTNGTLSKLRITCTTNQRGTELPRLYALRVDGKILVDSSLPVGKIKVVSTDTAANTMTVDGGSWTGSDGTNSGNAADRETKVTGPAKSGTGNFKSATGPVVDAVSTNQDWIDNTNRLGEAFFMKPASTRTGLAILRAKAAELASEFNLTTTYQTGDVVLYDDCYWVLDNGSWLKISESTTTY